MELLGTWNRAMAKILIASVTKAVRRSSSSPNLDFNIVFCSSLVKLS